MTEHVATPPPPGWYDDPNGPGRQRWWNGHAWTEHVNDPSPVPPSGASLSSPGGIGADSYGERSQPDQTTHTLPSSPRTYAAGTVFFGPLSIAVGVLVLVLVSVFGTDQSFITGVAVIVSAALGITGIVMAKRHGTGQWLSLAGLALGVLGLLLLTLIGLLSSPAFQDRFNSDWYDSARVEREIRTSAADQGLAVYRAECPDDPRIYDGATFRCLVTLEEGRTGFADIHIQDSRGTWTWEINPFN